MDVQALPVDVREPALRPEQRPRITRSQAGGHAAQRPRCRIVDARTTGDGGSHMEDDVSEALLAEVQRVSEEIRRILLRSSALLGIAISVGGVAAARANELPLVLAILPPLLITIVTTATMMFTDVVLLGGYVQVLEHRLNERLREPVTFWESAVAPRRHRDKSPFLNNVTNITLVAVITTSSQWTLWTSHRWIYPIASLLLLVPAIPAFLQALVEQRGGWQRARNISARFIADFRLDDTT